MQEGKPKSGIDRFIEFVNALNTWFQYVGIVILAAMTIAVFVAVVSRFFVGISLSWVEESATFAMAWICALGAGVTARKGGLTTIEIGVMWLPPKAKRIVAMIAALISFCIFFVIIYFGTKMAIVVNSQKAVTIPAMTMFWVYIAMPVGVFIMFFNTLIHIIETIRGEN